MAVPSDRDRARNAAAEAAFEDSPKPGIPRKQRPAAAPTRAVIEICLVETCSRVADTRGLCKRHYLSLSRALKGGIEWSMKTGKPVLSAAKPRSPFEEPEDLHSAGARIDRDLAGDELDRIRAHVEIDAARILPHALSFCLGQTLRRMGLADNPAALRAFAESCRILDATEEPATPRRKRVSST